MPTLVFPFVTEGSFASRSLRSNSFEFRSNLHVLLRYREFFPTIHDLRNLTQTRSKRWPLVSEEDFESGLEYLLADAEESVWSDTRQTSLTGVLAMLGLNF